jgi:hypothetical protein
MTVTDAAPRIRRRRHRFLERVQFQRAAINHRECELQLDEIRRSYPTYSEMTGIEAPVADAGRALDAGDIEGCWHFINIARRAMVGARNDGAVKRAAHGLLIEATKLSAWRRKAIENLLLDHTTFGTVTAATLQDALLYRDEYYENQYQRIAMQRDQLKILVLLALLALGAILGTLAAAPVDSLQRWDWRLMLVVFMFGLLGASFSAARSITTEATRTTIPELLLSNWITLSRTILGAAPGLAAYAALQSDILNLGDFNAPKAFAVAFVGGFSERLVVKVVESVAGK